MLYLGYDSGPLQLFHSQAGILGQIHNDKLIIVFVFGRKLSLILLLSRRIPRQVLQKMICLHMVSVWKHDLDRVVGLAGSLF